MRDLPSGTVTFLFTDIEDSTRLLHELGAEDYAAALADHRSALREAFSRHDGAEVDTQGDAFFVAFPTAPGALAAAREAQEALAIPVRMGVHTGTPLLTDEGYVGADVHRAARIAAAGHGGQVLVSAATATLLDASNNLLLDLGEHRLKDLSAPERIWQLGAEAFPRLKTLYQTNLPVPATAFVGREREVAEASELLLDGVRLVTLSGPGGTGKTRLALQAAAAAADGYPDGIWWVPLAPLADPALVMPTAGRALGAKGDLAAEIGDKRLLLLLDNFEHVIDAATDVGGLVSACPQLTVLVTSRERLQVAGEHEYPVPTLAPPDGFELFVSRANALGVEVGNEATRELCERLDNLPLALELAAARTKLFSPAQLLERLSERLDLFKGGRDADPRQRTLRATIEWSYDLLTPEEQQLFARISVFAGGCTYEAAEQICEADEDTLQSLLDKSLLRRRDGPAGESRYWMLETIREFALERLFSTAWHEDVAQRHALLFRDLALSGEPGLAGPTMGDWLERLAAEHANLRAAVAWFLDARRTEDAALTAVALARYLEARGHYTEGRAWLSEALRRGDLPLPLRAKAAYVLGRLADSQAEFPEAERLYREALSLFRELGDDEGAVAALIELAWATLLQGRVDEAGRIGDEALSRARELGDAVRVADALVNHAATLVERERFPEALALYEESLVLRRELGEPRAIAISLAGIGWVALLNGDSARAQIAAQQAVELMRANADRQWIGASLHTLGAAALAERDLDRAAAYFLEGLGEARELGDRRLAPECLVGLAAVAAEFGDAAAAADLDALAAAFFSDTGVLPSPVAQSIRREQLAAAKVELGEALWDSKYRAGSASFDEASALAAALARRAGPVIEASGPS
jgi:predicted ATPase